MPETIPRSKSIGVHFQYSPDFSEILSHLHATVIVSTYQAGKVLVLGVQKNQLQISFLDFDQPMGIAVGADRIAVGSSSGIQFLKANHSAASTVAPQGSYDGCYVAHTSRHTGRIMGHDLGWGHNGLWVVNTLFSCLCTLDDTHSFVPRWKPTFISRLADEDRCHLNGMAIEDGAPRYVSALAETDIAAGWRPNKANSGCLIDVQSGDVLTRGLAMPHSPRIFGGNLFVLNSGHGNLSQVDRLTGRLEPIEHMPGYTRGLAFHGQFAFVGLSRIRETNVFGGLPIGEHRDELCCGVAVIDMTSGKTVATFRFMSGVEEIFAVDVIPGYSNLAIGGASLGEQQNEIWIVPPDPPVDRMPQSGNAQQSADSLKRQALLAHDEGRLQDSLQYYEMSLQQFPDSPELLTNLGNLQQDLGNSSAALACYQKSVELQPKQSHTQRNLGVIYSARNQPHRALHHFDLAQQVDPHPMNFVLGAKLLPVIYDSKEQVTYWRERLTTCINDLVESGVTIDTSDSVIPTSFYFAYQGGNDRHLMQQLAKVYQGVQCCDAAKDGNWTPNGKKLRVGFVSAYFCQHTIGRLNLGVIERLPRNEFEVTVITLKSHNDQRSDKFRKAADHYIEVPRQSAKARQMIANLGLDILIFADVGMDCLSQTLCYSRMAPIQAATWGHPDTTGSPAIDYFISSDLAETEDADDHYSETLIRLPTLGVYYERPVLSGLRRDKAHFGLDPQRRVYLCPQTLFKFHPDFDEALRGILEADPDGDLVLIQSSTPEWNESLLKRWQNVLPDARKRVKFIPSQPRPEFLHLLSIADVMLDTFPFCGGNTSYEAIAVGTPVVTLPSEYLRGRLTYALYQRMQFPSLIASSVEHYVELALQIAHGDSSEIRRTIVESSAELFDSSSDVQAYAEMLRNVSRNTL
jgi:uncharacterized protein (TIGR03032 family)